MGRPLEGYLPYVEPRTQFYGGRRQAAARAIRGAEETPRSEHGPPARRRTRTHRDSLRAEHDLRVHLVGQLLDALTELLGEFGQLRVLLQQRPGVRADCLSGELLSLDGSPARASSRCMLRTYVYAGSYAPLQLGTPRASYALRESRAMINTTSAFAAIALAGSPGKERTMYFGYGLGGIILLVVVVLLLTGRL